MGRDDKSTERKELIETVNFLENNVYNQDYIYIIFLNRPHFGCHITIIDTVSKICTEVHGFN